MRKALGLSTPVKDWLDRLVPELGRFGRDERAQLVEQARHAAFRSHPGHGAAILLASLIGGFAISAVPLLLAPAWLHAHAWAKAAFLVATPLTALVLYEWLHARAIAPELRRLISQRERGTSSSD